MRIGPNQDGITTLRAAPDDDQSEIHFAASRATEERSVKRKTSGDSPDLEITGRVRKNGGGCVIDSVEGENISNAAADVFGCNEIIRSDNGPEKGAELSFILPAAAGQSSSGRGRVRGGISRSVKDYRARWRKRK